MIPETTGLLRGSNYARLPKIGAGGVAENAHCDSIFCELSSSSILCSTDDVAGGRQHPVQQTGLVEVVDVVQIIFAQNSW
jgi:hypothetical protein